MKYTTLIFDLDGTLLNTLEDLTTSVNLALNELNFPSRSIDEVKSFVGNGVKRLVYLSVPKGTDENTAQNCYMLFKKHYKNNYAVKTAPYEGIIDMLKKAKDMGYKIGVVTNKLDEASQEIVKLYFDGLIDTTIGHKKGLEPKPSPQGVYEVMDRLNSKIENCIYIGDSEVDCLTGHNAGLEVIGVTWGFRDREVLVANNAEYIIDTPKEIFGII